jgi:hypothetical protein
MEPFVKVPYVGLVSKFGKLEADLSMLNSTINDDEIAIAKHDVLEKVDSTKVRKLLEDGLKDEDEVSSSNPKIF